MSKYKTFFIRNSVVFPVMDTNNETIHVIERTAFDEAVTLLAATKHKIICINAGRHRPKTSCKSCELASQIDDFLKGVEG